MSFPQWVSLRRRASFLPVLGLVAAGLAHAQSSTSTIQPSFSSSNSSASSPVVGLTAANPGESSSAAVFSSGDSSSSLAALPSSPSPSAGGAGQNPPGRYRPFHHLAFEFGGGANAPADSDTLPYITWGGNFTVGAGLKFSRHFATLAEFQYLDDKLPGALIAQTGANGGNAHIWSLTLDPVWDLFPKAHNDAYITGGGGFYRKVTNFTDPEATTYCDPYYGYCGIGYVNTVVGHLSSNQGGVNIGMGLQHRFGDDGLKFFAEARYLDVMTPAYDNSPNGLGSVHIGSDTHLIPITLGLRW